MEGSSEGNFMWVYGRMGRKPSREGGGGGDGVKEVANTLWAYNLMWAYATMGREPGGRLLRALDARAVVLSTDVEAHHIVLTECAHAKIGTELSDELEAALSVREDALYVWGGYQNR